MANNCLVTQLKGVVDNDNLLKIDEFMIDVSSTSIQKFLKVNATGNIGTITVVGNGKLILDNVEYTSLPYSTNYFRISAGNYKLKFNNKYNIELLEGFDNIHTNDIKYCSNMKTLAVSHLIGDINDIPQCSTFVTGDSPNVYGEIKESTPLLNSTGLTSFTFNESKISGDISIISKKKPNIQRIGIAKSNITGSIENLVANFVDAGKTSGNITITMPSTQITIGGIVRDYRYDNCYLEWNGSTTWYYVNTTKNHVEEPTYVAEIYAKNATAEQIAAWEANNNVVTIIE